MASLVEIYNALRYSRVTFRTLRPQLTAHNNIYVGSNAVVLRCRLTDDDRAVALKCYANRRRNARSIYGDAYLAKELLIHTLTGMEYIDVTVLDWVEGHALDSLLRAPNTDYRALSKSFDCLALDTLQHSHAHGDVKPENVVVTPSGVMRLIDHDAAWLPGFGDHDAEEIGTPTYSHPKRDKRHFDKHIDDFSLAILSTMLAALAIKRDYFVPHLMPDGSLFVPRSVVDGSDELFNKALSFFERRDPAHYAIARTLYGSSGAIDGLAGMFEQAVAQHTQTRRR